MSDLSALRALAGLMDELAQSRKDNAVLSGQVERVRALHRPVLNAIRGEYDCTECGAELGVLQLNCPTVRALAIREETK